MRTVVHCDSEYRALLRQLSKKTELHVAIIGSARNMFVTRKNRLLANAEYYAPIGLVRNRFLSRSRGTDLVHSSNREPITLL